MKEQGGRVCERIWEHGKVPASESEREAAREGLRMQNKELALHGADADGMLECLREGGRFFLWCSPSQNQQSDPLICSLFVPLGVSPRPFRLRSHSRDCLGLGSHSNPPVVVLGPLYLPVTLQMSFCFEEETGVLKVFSHPLTL